MAPLAGLRQRLSGDEIWIKNDGLYGTLYGGNKPRKLEFILADALAKRKKTVLTTGAAGTNHGVATALYGRHVGLEVALLLTYEQPDETIARRLCWMQRAGAHLHYTRSLPQTVLVAPFYALRYRSPYLLGPGASSPLGAVGYVNAALELAEQVAQGQIPEPQTIVVPVGSAGTAAGLLLGLRIAGLESRLLAVAVTRAPTVWRVWVVRLANATGRLLVRRGVKERIPVVNGSGIDIATQWLGGGLGKPTRKGEEAMAILAETEGLELEPTYTGKTMAALIDLRRSGSLEGNVLYWHTYNGIASPPQCSREDYLRLPRAFHRFCPL